MARAESGLPEQISEKIIQLILDEHLEQGDRLPKEAVLVERLGAGRSTVREAMKLLQSRNIVRIKQGSGTYVASNPGVADDPLGFTFIDDKQRLGARPTRGALYDRAADGTHGGRARNQRPGHLYQRALR